MHPPIDTIMEAPSRSKNIVIALLGAGFLGASGLWVHESGKREGEANARAAVASEVQKTLDAPVKVRTSKVLAKGTQSIPAGDYLRREIVVTPEMKDAVFTGKFRVEGGFRNDVTAVVAGEEAIENWLNGHRAAVEWQTPGKQTVGTFRVPLKPGKYAFIVSNRFAILSRKLVDLDVELEWTKLVNRNPEPGV